MKNQGGDKYRLHTKTIFKLTQQSNAKQENVRQLLGWELRENTKEPDTVFVIFYTNQHLRAVMEDNKVPPDGHQSDHDWVLDEEGDVEMVSSSTPR